MRPMTRGCGTASAERNGCEEGRADMLAVESSRVEWRVDCLMKCVGVPAAISGGTVTGAGGGGRRLVVVVARVPVCSGVVCCRVVLCRDACRSVGGASAASGRHSETRRRHTAAQSHTVSSRPAHRQTPYQLAPTDTRRQRPDERESPHRQCAPPGQSAQRAAGRRQWAGRTSTTSRSSGAGILSASACAALTAALLRCC